MRSTASHKAKILIIDDEAEMIEAYRLLLGWKGNFEIQSTVDPTAATRLFQEFQPDLVLLDMSMPVMSGLQVLAALRAIISEKSYLPIVMVSADPRIETRREALDGGANDFVSKPFDPPEFLARIGNLLETRFADLARAEEAKRESDERFAGAFENAPIGMAMFRTAGTIFKVNRALCELFGYSEVELLTRTFHELTHREDLEACIELLQRLVAGEGSSFQLEKRYLHARGHFFTVLASISLVRESRGQPLYLIAQMLDISERKRAEEELRWKTAFLEAQLNSSPDGILVVNEHGRKVFQNRQMVDLFKIPAAIAAENDDTSQIKWISNIVKNPAQFLEKAALLYSRPDEIGRDEIELKNGEILDRYSAPVIGTDGKYYGRIWTFRDITERKRSEQVAERALRRLTEAQRIGQIGDWEWDLDTQEITWSPQVFEIFGRDPSLGPPASFDALNSLYEAHSLAVVQENVARAIESGEAQEYEHVIVQPNGDRIHGQAMAVPRKDESGRVVGLYGTLQDITARKRAEAALRASEEEFRTLAEAMPQIVWIARPDGWNLYISKQWTDYSGLTVEESLGLKWSKSLHPDDQARAGEAWQHAMATHGHYSVECRMRRADGMYRWWLVRAVPLLGATGQVLKWFGTCTDIHDLKVAELEISRAKLEIEQLNTDLERRVERRTEALRAATLEAESANTAKSAFLSRMSHELRTPMNAILGFAQVLESEEGLNGEQQESVQHILKGGSHLLELINEVLDISSIEAGSLALFTEAVALPDLLEETVSLLRPLWSKSKIQINVIDPEDVSPCVQADRQRLKQVLLNLLGNAIKYNRPGGRVIVRHAASSPAVTRLSVTDTGIGLSPEKLARLFNPFERLGAEQTRVEGTGLGLVLAKNMVEHMGGRLGVESIVGEGTTFWVELPIAESPAEPDQSMDEVSTANTPGSNAEIRVLLYIEDNPSNVRLVTRILARRPAIRLLSAETGSLGWKMACEQRPDLILLDLHLPDTHGSEMLERLSRDASTAAIPVVMLSADAMPHKREELLAAGARAFITKPLNVRDFLEMLDRFLSPEVSAAI